MKKSGIRKFVFVVITGVALGIIAFACTGDIMSGIIMFGGAAALGLLITLIMPSG